MPAAPSESEFVRDRDGHDRAEDSNAAEGVISVALIDDNCLVREGIASLLDQFPDIRVAASDSKGFDTLLDEFAAEVVVLELDVIHTNSMVIVKTLRRDYPETRVILMDHIPAGEDVARFVEAGVCGFIHKDATLNQVLLTIRAVASGLDVLPDLLVDSLFTEVAREAVANGNGQDPEWGRLTDREREVLDLIGQGLSNKAIPLCQRR